MSRLSRGHRLPIRTLSTNISKRMLTTLRVRLRFLFRTNVEIIFTPLDITVGVAFSTSSMTAYQVKNTTSCETNFGRIPYADVYYPHIQFFGKLTDEYFKSGRLVGSSSDNHFTLFTSPNLVEGLRTTRKRLTLGSSVSSPSISVPSGISLTGFKRVCVWNSPTSGTNPQLQNPTP